MKQLTYRIKGQSVRIRVVETERDLPEFEEFIWRHEILGFDTETTGLDWWSEDFRLRLAQFGSESEAYVVPADLGQPFRGAVRNALERVPWLVAHNGGFDLHVVETCLGIPMEDLASKVWDTKLIAHLVDPRAVKERGPGLKLEELVKFYLDPVTAEEVKGSMTALAQKYKTTKEKIWPLVELFDESYLRYAGMDPVLAIRLFKLLYPLVPIRSKAQGLIGWEHRLAHVTAIMERTGYLLDVGYAEKRASELLLEQTKWEEVVKSYGIENPNSNAQLITAFTDLGIVLTKKTKKGNLALDDDVLQSISHPMAEAVVRARKASKWRATWFLKALEGRDAENRVRASINSLQARTGRMTISGTIAAQTFPKGSGYVRNMFLAEEDHVSVSIDFGNMELRFLAAYCRDPTMLDAFLNGKDLHQITADAAGAARNDGKRANFLTVFGGGWQALVAGGGIDEPIAKRVLEAFARTYPGVGVFAKKLSAEARRTGYVWTVTGRRVPVDPGKWFRALNYFIQSGSRDVTARAILELHKAGYSEFMRLPIHDELIFSFPKKHAVEMAREAARIMEFRVNGLLIPAEAEIGHRSWGSILDMEASKH
ncbi:DNA polymerase [Streptomyces sp. NPDC087850]|uniref:DNA polymerase n=1 Tax=Streptomyces sp. NPDC087850 TaxID=3365809 RepID=UPI00382A67D3